MFNKFRGKNVEDFIAENGKSDDYAEFMKLVEGDKKKNEKKGKN